MIYLAYVLLALSLLSFALLVRLEGTRRAFIATPFNVYGAFYLLSTVGAPFALYHSGYSRDVWAILVTLSGFLAFQLGFVLVLGKRNLALQFVDSAVEDRHAESAVAGGLVAGVGVLIGLSFFYYRGWPPLLAVLGDAITGRFPETDVDSLLKIRRFELTKGHYFGGEYRGQGLVSEGLKIGWSYLVCVAFILHRRTRRVSWLVVAVVLAVGCFFVLVGAGVRWNVVLFFVTLVVLSSYLRRLRVRVLAAVAVLGTLSLIVVSASIG